MKWRKGQTEILTTTLLIVISVIASSFVFATVQPQNFVPIADEPSILEKIDIVQVVKSSDSAIQVGILNTGGYDAIIDVIYVKDADDNLLKVFQVGGSLPVDGMVNIALPTTGQDTRDWIFFKAVTKRGNSDTQEISTTVDRIPGYAINYYASLVNVSFNGVPITNPVELAKLYELDDYFLNASTLIKTFEGTTVNPLGNQSYEYDPTTGEFKVVGSGGSAIHFIVANNKATIVLGGIMNLEGILHKIKLNVLGELPVGLNSYSVNVTYFDFVSNRYALPGESGYMSANNIPLDKKPNVNITFMMGNAWEYVDPSNGNWSIMMNFTLNGNPKNQKLDLANITLTPIYIQSIDGLFVYSIAQPTDLSKIQSISFNITNQCNVSSAPFLLKIFNYAESNWNVLGTYTSSPTPNTPSFFSTVIQSNINSYIGADRRLMINFVPSSFLEGTIVVSFDQARLSVVYIN